MGSNNGPGARDLSDRDGGIWASRAVQAAQPSRHRGGSQSVVGGNNHEPAWGWPPRFGGLSGYDESEKRPERGVSRKKEATMPVAGRWA